MSSQTYNIFIEMFSVFMPHARSESGAATDVDKPPSHSSAPPHAQTQTHGSTSEEVVAFWIRCETCIACVVHFEFYTTDKWTHSAMWQRPFQLWCSMSSSTLCSKHRTIHSHILSLTHTHECIGPRMNRLSPLCSKWPGMTSNCV